MKFYRIPKKHCKKYRDCLNHPPLTPLPSREGTLRRVPTIQGGEVIKKSSIKVEVIKRESTIERGEIVDGSCRKV
jgi:hypothetical protein